MSETAERFRITLDAADSQLEVDVEAGHPWKSDLFPTFEDASEFYRRGPVGWSPRLDGNGVEALELVSQNWAGEPGFVHSARSSFSSTRFRRARPCSDSAVVMRDLPLVWETPTVEFCESVPA